MLLKKRQIERLSKKDTVGSTKRLHGFVQFAVSKRNVFVTREAPPILASRGIQPSPWVFPLESRVGPVAFSEQEQGLETRLRRM